MAQEKARQKKTQLMVENQLRDHRLWLDNAKQVHVEQPAVVYDVADGNRQMNNIRVRKHFYDDCGVR
jgi:hypothetical protein